MRDRLPSQVYRDEADAASVFEYLISQYANPAGPPYVLGMESKEARELIGPVGFSPLDSDVEIGFAIEKRFQGQGPATEAVRAACDWAAKTFSLSCVIGITASSNHASRRVLLRSGFAPRGKAQMAFQGQKQCVVIFEFNLPG